MKIQKITTHVSPFAGISFVNNEFNITVIPSLSQNITFPYISAKSGSLDHIWPV